MTKVLDNRVELKVPVAADYVSVVRLLISSLGARLGLPISEIENLKLMVGEAFLTIVQKAESVPGLIHLAWKQDASHVTISMSDPSGRHKSVMNSASLSLLKNLGGEVTSTVVDGVEHVDLDFRINYRENRPFLFDDERGAGRA
jgi:hypothetical protein